MEHADQPLGAFVGQRLEDDGIDYGENRRVGADAQRQRQQCNDREARRTGKASKTVANVLAKGVHERVHSASRVPDSHWPHE